MILKEKTYVNTLITDQLIKISMKEKQALVKYLLKDRSLRELSALTGIPHTTLNGWKTLKKNAEGNDFSVDLNSIFKKLVKLDPSDIDDWGRVEQIKEVTENLLRQRK